MAQKSFDVTKIQNGPITFEHRRSLLDDPFTGDRLPERLGTGPVERKRVTDVIFMVICLVFLFIFIVFGIIYGVWNNYNLITKPMDSDARICGLDGPVKDHKFLMLFKFDRNYRSVCVRKCPVFDYNQIKYNANGTNMSIIQPLYYENYTSVVRRPYTFGYGESDGRNSNFDYDPDFASGYFSAEDFNSYRDNFNLDCVPNTDITSCKHNPLDGINLYDARPYTLNICFPLSPKIMRRLQLFGDMSAGFYADIASAKWLILLSMISALLLGILFLFLSSFFISWLIWVMLVVFVLVAVTTGIMCWIVAFGNYSSLLSSRNYSPYLVKQYGQLHESKWQMIITGIVMFGLATSVVLFAIFNIKSIKQASSILKFTVTLIAKNIYLVILGIVCFVLQVLVFFLALWILVGIYTSGDLVRDSIVGEPIPRFDLGFFRWCWGILTILSTYWIFCFINNFADFVAAASTVNFYFNKRNGFFSAIIDAFKFHFGSIAFASLVMPPISLLQFCFGWLFDLLTATGNEGEANAAQNIGSKICICFVYPYRRWILRSTEAAFGMVHMASADFWVCSKETYYLFLAYSNKIGKIDLVVNLYKLVVVITISIINASIFSGIMSINYYVRSINNPFIPTVTIFFTTLIITLLFMNIYATVTQAAILCHLIETDTGRMPRNQELSVAMQQSELANGLNIYDPLK